MNDFEAQAKAVEQETYDRLASQVNPETYSGDGSELYETALDAGLSFYETMNSLYQATLNLFSAGLFHLIEQHLANLTHDAAMETAVADTQLDIVTDYYRDHLKLDFTHFAAWNVISEMRLVANTTKHGEGRSAEELRNMRPELFRHPALRKDPEGFSPQFWLQLPLGGDGLYVTAEDFHRYENAANALLQFVFEHFNNNHELYFPS